MCSYGSAAKYRDLLKELETEAKKAAALAAEWDTTSPNGELFCCVVGKQNMSGCVHRKRTLKVSTPYV